MQDSYYYDYVFFRSREKDEVTEKIRRFPSSSHHFFAKSPSRANFLLGHLNRSLRAQINLIRPEGRGEGIHWLDPRLPLVGEL